MADVRLSQLIAEAMAAGVDSARITQLIVEALNSPDPEARFTQLIVEAMGPDPTPDSVRLSQLIVEAMALELEKDVRATHLIVEVLASPTPDVRTTQLIVEVLALEPTAAAGAFEGWGMIPI